VAVTQQDEDGGTVPVPAQVLARAQLFADRPAICGDGVVLSYAALLADSARYAAALHAAGIGPGRLVGLGFGRGAPRLVALLATWRLGAAAVMLDAGWPARRLAQVVAEAGCDLVLLDDPAVVDGLAGVPARTPAMLREDGAGDVPFPALAPDDLAYVIYTSGSTGRPKGVEVTHGNLAALVAWHNRAFAVSEHDRATHLAGLAFDAAIWEVWPYLAAGASVHLVPEPARGSAERLRDCLLDTRATIAFAPTLLAEQLVGLAWPADADLRLLLTGGDRLRATPPAGLPFAMVNNYGPTECTVVATSGPVPPGGTDIPSIGRPITGNYVRILGEDGAALPPGAVGEICVGGRGVARGYRHQPEATAAAFVPDPEIPGTRLYRTGDLGAWRADGAIDFHGRVDHQLKIRGQRVEPDEVAAVLTGHPQVRAAAVTGIDRPGGVVLAAYVEIAGAPPAAEELHAFLADRLPDWSVPAHYVALAQLPVTAHGKLDRAALPDPSDDNALPTAVHAGAASIVEERLLAILQEVMGTSDVGVDDNFFLLGGHSLLGTQVVLRAGAAFGVELTLRHLFHAPTVRALALVIEELVGDAVAALSEEEVAERVHG